MLILTRRIGETIIIGDDVNITVLAVNGNQVRIGINAPTDTPVHREEIYHKIQNEKDDKRPTDSRFIHKFIALRTFILRHCDGRIFLLFRATFYLPIVFRIHKTIKTFSLMSTPTRNQHENSQ